MNLFNLPAHYPFLKSLAAGVLQQSSESQIALHDFTILLPNRRACRHLQQEFLQASDGKPLLLPRIAPIGDIDEEELILLGASPESLPPAMPTLQRQAILARMIGDWHAQKKQSPIGFLQSWAMAGDLGGWIDQIQIEQLDFAHIKNLVPENFALHWQEVTEFLSIFSQSWIPELKKYAMVDESTRRIALLESQAQFWQTNPSPKPVPKPVIAAGSTGSIQATSKLLRAIANMPMGAVILPGLDQNLDEDSWESIDTTHPQFFLKKLTDHFGAARSKIKTWPFAPVLKDTGAIQLWSEVLRPAENIEQWRQAKIDARSLQNLNLIECKHGDEEAKIIAILMRETLETPGKTASLVTPDRNLTRRVISQLRRWNIAVDDGAGQGLHQTVLGQFLLSFARAIEGRFKPDLLLALLKHPFTALDQDPIKTRYLVYDLEIALRRNENFIYSPTLGFDQYKSAIYDSAQKEFLQKLEFIIAPLIEKFSLADFLRAAESLAQTDNKSGAIILWSGDAGEAAANLMTQIMDLGKDLPELSWEDAPDFLEQCLGTVTIRSPYDAHPRLRIWGLLEARLQHADRLILAGLNEGVWPPPSEGDPWMSRPMRDQFGLPSRERRIGQTAHDLAQLACQPAEIFLTRSNRDAGAPCLASRFWVRLTTLLQSKNMADPVTARAENYHAMAKQLDRVDETIFINAPAPKPPSASRPHKFSATSVELWMRDPYAFYAKYILNLRKLDEIERKFEHLAKGNFLHAILEEFINGYQTNTSSPHDYIRQLATDKLRPWLHDPYIAEMWWPRLCKILDWFVGVEQARRDMIRQSVTETKGDLHFAIGGVDYILSAAADRIDGTKDGSISIIDYKSGKAPTLPSIKAGFSPQLPLEAAIHQGGGFANCPKGKIGGLEFWELGSQSIKTIDKDLEKLADDALAGLQRLIEQYQNPAQPYASAPHGEYYLRNRDYNHLSRIAEWGDLGEAS